LPSNLLKGEVRGLPSFDIADRLEILNQLNLYAHYFDEGMVDAWVSLFTQDTIFNTTQRSGTDLTATFSGHDELRDLASTWASRRDEVGQNRHVMTSIAVLNQSDQEADVLALGLLVRTHPDGRTTFWSPGRYAGVMRKSGDTWLIHRWNFQWDADPAMNL
jgi:3-phenylpropionate/cinnamic acid dioxygenase small subunit